MDADKKPTSCPRAGDSRKRSPNRSKIQKVIEKEVRRQSVQLDQVLRSARLMKLNCNFRNPPPISMPLDMEEGTGAGFAGLLQRGKVRLIRLEYDGGDWNLNFGIGGDANMLME